MKLRAFGTILSALFLSYQLLLGQPSKEHTEEIELTRTIIQAQRQAMVEQTMSLSQEEAKTFWTLYGEYRTAIERLGDRAVKVITTYADNIDNLSDEMAEALVVEHLEIQREEYEIRLRFFPRFKEILPVKKAARFFQLENKLDALIDYDAARKIPLLESD